MRRVNKRAGAENLAIFIAEKKTNWCQFFHASVLLLSIDNQFRQNIVKVVFGSARLSPQGSAATLTML